MGHTHKYINYEITKTTTPLYKCKKIPKYTNTTYDNFSMKQLILQYGITAWGGLGIVASNKILRAQKTIIKIILKKPKTYSTTQLYKEFNVLSVQKLFQRNSLYFIYKMNLIKFKT